MHRLFFHEYRALEDSRMPCKADIRSYVEKGFPLFNRSELGLKSDGLSNSTPIIPTYYTQSCMLWTFDHRFSLFIPGEGNVNDAGKLGGRPQDVDLSV